jgi:DNA ligase-associated metallophosphoesterase
MTIEINNFEFTLLPEKALYKHDEALLIIADVHLGKASHFRNSGIPMPAHAQMSDYDNLKKVFEKTTPKKVYFLGDLFHSTFNRDWHYFCDLIALFPAIAFTLIKGNHDIIHTGKFDELCIKVVARIEDEAFIYTHEPLDEVPDGKVNIVGHIHPGVTISGMARQSIKLSCFYITRSLVILPAFGVLTGLYSMGRSGDPKIFIVLPDTVKQLL